MKLQSRTEAEAALTPEELEAQAALALPLPRGPSAEHWEIAELQESSFPTKKERWSTPEAEETLTEPRQESYGALPPALGKVEPPLLPEV